MRFFLFAQSHIEGHDSKGRQYSLRLALLSSFPQYSFLLKFSQYSLRLIMPKNNTEGLPNLLKRFKPLFIDSFIDPGHSRNILCALHSFLLFRNILSSDHS